MIRFVDLRGQATGHRFAFWNTVTDKFCSFLNEQAWDTEKDFEEAFVAVPVDSPESGSIHRFISLMPDWVRTEPTDAEMFE